MVRDQLEGGCPEPFSFDDIDFWPEGGVEVTASALSLPELPALLVPLSDSLRPAHVRHSARPEPAE
jgi:hypothetical protein